MGTKFVPTGTLLSPGDTFVPRGHYFPRGHCPQGTILSPGVIIVPGDNNVPVGTFGDKIVPGGQYIHRVILAISGLLAISLTFCAKNDPKTQKGLEGLSAE